MEGLNQVRLEAVSLPHLKDRGIRDAEFGRQFTRAPVGRILRLGLRRDAYDFRRIDARLASAARQICQNRFHATRSETAVPACRLDGDTGADSLALTIVLISLCAGSAFLIAVLAGTKASVPGHWFWYLRASCFLGFGFVLVAIWLSLSPRCQGSCRLS